MRNKLRNPVAKDLRTPKYRMRVVKDKRAAERKRLQEQQRREDDFDLEVAINEELPLRPSGRWMLKEFVAALMKAAGRK